MILDYLLVALSITLVGMGFLGCILPIIPGPPLSWAGLLVVYFTRYGNFNINLIVWTGIAALLVSIIDYILPIWATKKMGGSQRGVWGATIGIILGMGSSKISGDFILTHKYLPV